MYMTRAAFEKVQDEDLEVKNGFFGHGIGMY